MKQIKQSVMAFIVLTIITGLIYPIIVTGVSQLLFSYQANGSLIKIDNQIRGSELIGQNFSSDKYLWGRPSATGNYPYNAMASGGSNLGPTNPQLFSTVKDRVAKLLAINNNPVPIDLVTSSGSGLDPEVSIAAAYFQMSRIAKARNMTGDQVEKVINMYAKYPIWGIWGTPRVNVLQVNLALDQINHGGN